jgi:hypothetical protein
MTARRIRVRLHKVPLRRRRARALWLGLVGGLLARWFGGRVTQVRPEDLKRHDFPTSTQRVGVRFTERIRDTFRFRWIRRAS